jgi:hypothetical protein
MITSADDEYKATKLIKERKAVLEPLFAELADWIVSRWQVPVLNVIYDQPIVNGRNKRPRLQIILEHTHEYQRFLDGYNFDQLKQEAIAARFTEIVNREEPAQYKLDGLFVVFSAFAPVAREEAHSQITDAEVLALQERIANPALWTIHRSIERVTFMFYTKKQARLHKRKGFRDTYADLYFELLKPHDPFAYLNRSQFSVDFDSKENFDKKFESNWIYYDR